MCDSLDEFDWLYRGVPIESPEVEDVAANGEIRPRRPDNVGEYARYCHVVNEMTDTAYSSWSTDSEIAKELARYACDEADLSGEIIVFKVRISSIGKGRIYEGEAREDEYLIEGTVEDVVFCENPDEDET